MMLLVLERTPTDDVALKCKAACLVHLGLFDQVVSDSSLTNLTFERAYSLYRLNKLQEAKSLLAGNTEVRTLRLLGQVVCFAHVHCTFFPLTGYSCYRMEDYAKAIEVYEQLVADPSVRHVWFPPCARCFIADLLFLCWRRSKRAIVPS